MGSAVKKILIAQDIHALLRQDSSFLARADLRVLVAATNDEMLKVHRAERADLIITDLDLPGMSSERLCGLIQQDAALRTASMIMACANTPESIRNSSQCRPNAVLLRPLHPVLLMAKARQLLDISARETIRVLLSARVQGRSPDGPFYCRTRNISATGMMIETDKHFAEGTRLSSQFYLPDAQSVRVTGTIVRIIQQTPGNEDYQYGLMFSDLTPETRQLLLDFVERAARGSREG